MVIPPDIIKKLHATGNIAVLTGAGISQESGLRTFRDGLTGLWAKYNPEDLATPEAFERSPELVWEFYSSRRLKVGEVQPNPGHFALREMERQVRHFTLITQNVDDLHRRAGSKSLVELHGNITRVKCSKGCGVVPEWETVPGKTPICPDCGAKLRPDVVWFGEPLAEKNMEAALKAAKTCGAFLSIGTSGLVNPAATLPLVAKKAGSLLVEINMEETVLTPLMDYFLRGKSGEILPEVVKAVWGK